MPETLQKLTPDRDLQCYFFEPSAVAALSSSSATGYTVSGTWRQQFDWAVIEWNRDNVFEHPAFRYLPDGDLSGLTLSYQETRENCIPLDSSLFPTVDWPTLRVWANNGSGEQIYFVPLATYATAIAGSYHSATVQFTLSGTVTAGDYVGIAFLLEHYPYLMTSGDTPDVAIALYRFGNQWFFDDRHGVGFRRDDYDHGCGNRQHDWCKREPDRRVHLCVR